jgi:LysM repeat protein
MRYKPKHAAPRRSHRVAGVAAIGAAGLVAGLTTAAPASAQTDVWDRVAACESGGNWSINTGNGFYGGLQFYQPTWVGFGGQQYAAYAHQASKSQQIAIARKVLASQGPGAWPVCSVRAGLTRANGGASSTASAPASTPSAPSTSSSQPRQESSASRQESSAPRQQSAPRQESSAPRTTSTSGANYTVKAGDTVSGLAQRFGTSVSAIVSANGLSNGGRLIYVGDRLAIPGAGASSASSQSSGSYTVKAGDTVSELAARYGTSVAAIASASSLSDPDFIVVGQKLSIPGA